MFDFPPGPFLCPRIFRRGHVQPYPPNRWWIGKDIENDLATNEAEPLFGAASFVESQIRQKSLAMLMESVSGLHLQLQASSWSDTS
jgi:hypothetical protein